MDRFTVAVISQTPNPQQVMYAAMHQDYAEEFVAHGTFPDEPRCGELIINNLLKGGRGHYGPLEHPQIVLNVGWFPHSTMQQIRTHRVGVSFDVQCLAGDTEVTFGSPAGAPRTMTLESLYALWSGDGGRDDGAPSPSHRLGSRQQLRQMPLQVLNEATGRFETSHVQTVMDSGIQPVYRLTLGNGHCLDCTTNHRLYTTSGWQLMGDALGLITTADHRVLATTKPCRVVTQGSGARGDLSPRVPALVAAGGGRSRMAPLPRTVLPPQMDTTAVVGVAYLGLKPTYDLEVAGPWHNFVANGVVVHNSFRYTGQRIIDVVEGKREVEEVFYLRPLGFYTDRQGKKYEYTAEQRQQDLAWCLEASRRYQQKIAQGFAEEHARGLIPFDIRQHWVMSANVRSLMHLLDLRWKADAQLEAQKMCEAIWPHFQAWVPAIADWYELNRLKKARLAP